MPTYKYQQCIYGMVKDPFYRVPSFESIHHDYQGWLQFEGTRACAFKIFVGI